MTNKNTSTNTSTDTFINEQKLVKAQLMRVYVVTNKFSREHKLVRSHLHVTELAETLRQTGVMGKYDKLTQLTNPEAYPMEIQQRVMYKRLKRLMGFGSFYARVLHDQQQPEDLEELLDDVYMAMWQYEQEHHHKIPAARYVEWWENAGYKAVDKFVKAHEEYYWDRVEATTKNLYYMDPNTGDCGEDLKIDPVNVTEKIDELADPYWRMQMLDYNNNSQRLIDAVMSKLTVMDQEIIRLHAQGYSNRQIGDELGCDEGTVRYHLKTGIKAVTRRYEKAYTALQAHKPH